MIKQWYVIQTYSGYEHVVKKFLERKILELNINYMFDKILVPTEEIIEMKFGKKKISERKFFPGYILVKMVMNNDLWHIIKNIPRVLGFIGGKTGNPIPISEKEVIDIVDKIQESEVKPKPKVLFNIGEVIRVIDGPFSDFNGTVEEVNYDKNRLKVAVLIFGRSTPVDLNFSQVEKS